MKKIQNPTEIILHTAAFRGKCDALLIDTWHKEKGWEAIGYHFVVTGSFWDTEAAVQIGRPMGYQGAHVFGRNKRSIGICVTGHGDHAEWTDEQIRLACALISDLQQIYNIPTKKVIGHRETFIGRINLPKTCPGKLIDMNEFRKHLAAYKQSARFLFDHDWINLEYNLGTKLKFLS